MPYRPLTSADAPPDSAAPPLVFIAGAALAGTAGYINVVMLAFFAVPVSHMTGAVSRLGVDIGTGDMADFLLVTAIVVGFLVGAFLSGLLIGRPTLKPGRRYGTALLLEAALLTAATFLVVRGIAGAIPLTAMACGLQNGMASSYRGLILRTTHVTGIVTDIGVLIGHKIRHRNIQSWKLWLLTALLIGFFAGGVLGAFALSWLGMAALALAAATCALAGTAYLIAWYIASHRGGA